MMDQKNCNFEVWMNIDAILVSVKKSNVAWKYLWFLLVIGTANITITYCLYSWLKEMLNFT